MWRSNKRWILAVCLILCLILSSCKGKDLGPEYYELEGSSKVPSLTKLLEGEGGAFLSMELPEPKEEGAKEEDPTAHDVYIYNYHELPEGGLTVKAYIDILITSELEFAIVNAAGKQVDPPDFTAESGAVVLSRANLERKNMLRLVITWEADTCTIKAALVNAATRSDSNPDGPNSEAPLEVETRPASGGALSADEAVAFLNDLPPSVLKLPKDSMEHYNIYFLDGKVIVNGVSCYRLRIYDTSDPEGSNTIAGTYLLTGNGSNLYLLDLDTNRIEELFLQ